MRQRCHPKRCQHRLVSFAQRPSPPTAYPWQVERYQRLRGMLAQIGIGAALHNAEQRLAGIGTRSSNACRDRSGPSQRELHRTRHIPVLGWQRDAFIELHLNVRAELALNLDRAFRRQHMPAAIDVALEGDALLGQFAQVGERHHLESRRYRSRSAYPSA